MQLAALAVEVATQRLDTSVERLAHRPGHRQILDHVAQHFEVVESAQYVLNPLELAHASLRPRLPSLPGQLERVAQLLCCNPNVMNAVRDIERSGRRDGFPHSLRPALQSDREHLGPRVGLRAHRQQPSDVGQVSFELARVHGRESVEHSFAAFVSLIGQVALQSLPSLGVDPLLLDEPRHDPNRYVDFPHATQGTSDTTEATPDAVGRPTRHLGGTERQNLAEPTRGHTPLMERLNLAQQGGGEMLAECPTQPLKGQQQWLGGRHGRMSRRLAEPVPEASDYIRTPRQPMRIAAIDIGTNSIHMIVVQVRPDRSFEVIDREKEMVRLGSGGLGGRALTESSMVAGLQVLSKFRRLAESHDVDEIIAAATSAVREADNGREFLNTVRQRTGIQAQVISGTEEARLIHLAAVYGVDVSEGAAVVIDIGGGSVELTRGTPAKVQVAQSVRIGVIRLTEQFVKSDPLSPRDERRLTKCIGTETAAVVDQIVALGFDRVIGTSGTIQSLGQLAASEEGAVGPDDLRHRRISAKQIRRVRRELSSMTLAERLQIPKLDPRRADLAVAGSVLLDTLLKKLGAKELTLCDLALREGLALDYIRKNQARIAKIEKYPDVRRRSVIELAERCNYSRNHAAQVARMALTMFDQTQASHGLGAREREWLEYAAMLHDIGVHISYGRHHKHSYYLVKNGDLRGFEPQEVEVMALATRYHRRGVPKRSHEGYGELSRELRRTVKTLAALLRVAEGLDRSHQQSVASLEIVPGGQDYLLKLKPAGDTELELWAAQRSVAPLESVLHRIIRFEVIAPHPRRRKPRVRAPRTTPRRPPRRTPARAGTTSIRATPDRPGIPDPRSAKR